MRSTATAPPTCTPTPGRCWPTGRRRRTSRPSPSSARTAGARASTPGAARHARGCSRSRNAALDELRRRKRTAALTFDPAAEPEPTVDEREGPERRATVRAALATLDARERELVALKFHAGLANAEIGTLLGISESNAGTKVHRAVTKLRKSCA